MFCRCIPCSMNCSESTERTLLQRLEHEFPTSQGKRPSNLTTEAASPSPWLSLYSTISTSRSRQRLTLQLRRQGIQPGCGKSVFNSLLTWFKAWSWTEMSQKVRAVITGAYRMSFPLLFGPKVMTWVIKCWWIRKMSKKQKENIWGRCGKIYKVREAGEMKWKKQKNRQLERQRDVKGEKGSYNPILKSIDLFPPNV